MDNGPFVKLPAEVRVQIFQLALESPNNTNILIYDDKGPSYAPWMTSNHHRALTMVCRVFRAEAFPIYYSFTKVYLFPVTLDNFVPGFFRASHQDEGLMHWEYLGYWLAGFLSFFTHLGPACKKQIQDVEVSIGTWNSHWSSQPNQLMDWLTYDLAGVLRVFRGTHTQVCFRFNLEYHEWDGEWFGDKKVLDVSLPISNLEAAYRVLEVVVRKGKEARNGAYPSSHDRYPEHLDKCFVLLYQYLAFLEMQVEEDSGDSTGNQLSAHDLISTDPGKGTVDGEILRAGEDVCGMYHRGIATPGQFNTLIGGRPISILQLPQKHRSEPGSGEETLDGEPLCVSKDVYDASQLPFANLSPFGMCSGRAPDIDFTTAAEASKQAHT